MVVETVIMSVSICDLTCLYLSNLNGNKIVNTIIFQFTDWNQQTFLLKFCFVANHRSHFVSFHFYFCKYFCLVLLPNEPHSWTKTKMLNLPASSSGDASQE